MLIGIKALDVNCSPAIPGTGRVMPKRAEAPAFLT
jgi:hypothetical protein